jgi:predicted Ser/Thr protein kinase
MRIIHVSGNIRKVDIGLDRFLEDSLIVDSKELLTDKQRAKINSVPSKSLGKWNKYMNSAIQNICSTSNAKNLVFVGTLNDSAPERNLMEFPSDVAKRYFISSKSDERNRVWHTRNGYEPITVEQLKYHISSPNFLIGDMDSYTSNLYKRLVEEFPAEAMAIVDSDGVIKDENLNNILESMNVESKGDTRHKLSVLWQKLKYPDNEPINLFSGDIGDLKGTYDIIGQLGKGSFGTVFHCRNKQRQEPDVAIKLFNAKNRDAVISLRKEVTILQWLVDDVGNPHFHPNLLMYYGTFSTTYNGRSYYAIKIEYFSGKTLEEFLSANIDLNKDQLADIFLGVLSALKFLHDHGIVHRDVKLENIMYNYKMNRVFVIDLGLSEAVADVANKDSIMTSRVVGTPIYVSPELFGLNEIFRKQEIYEILFAADVWAVGVSIAAYITDKQIPWWNAIRVPDMDTLIRNLTMRELYERNLSLLREQMTASESLYPGFLNLVEMMLRKQPMRIGVTNALHELKRMRFPYSCVNCNKVGVINCKNCEVFYCSTKCQKQTAVEHGFVCGQ